jgi:TPR repeat protein
MRIRVIFYRLAVAGCLLSSIAAWCGQLEDGIAARERGEFKSAFNVFSQLASKGDARSQFQLSLLYTFGKGVTPDAKAALYWLRQAAIHGDSQAQSNLGVAFNRGRGVPQDEIKAYAWFTMAASAGDAVAATNRDVASRKFTLVQLEQAKALALQCRQGNFRPCL